MRCWKHDWVTGRAAKWSSDGTEYWVLGTIFAVGLPAFIGLLVSLITIPAGIVWAISCAVIGFTFLYQLRWKEFDAACLKCQTVWLGLTKYEEQSKKDVEAELEARLAANELLVTKYEEQSKKDVEAELEARLAANELLDKRREQWRKSRC